MADIDKDNLIYYKIKNNYLKLLEKVSLGFWTICAIADITYYYTLRGTDVRFELSNCHMVLTCFNYLIPTLIKVGESWSNSVFHNLFDLL